MRFFRRHRSITAWLLILAAAVLLPLGASAQDAEEQDSGKSFTREELTQMLAPIALYPDSLVAQVLMASTYPLELIEAERWLRQNRNLKGDELDAALQEKEWDPSVKALCRFPDILFSMSEKIDQTKKLGDAFLGQEDEVMVTIQELRRKADEQGTLNSMKQEKIIREETIIRIEPADPAVVYVPVYDPLCAYGSWWYPAYPPYYWWYPSRYLVAGSCFGYGPSFHFGVGIFAWTWFDWPHRHIIIHRDRVRHFHKWRAPRRDDRPFWRHDPRHRRGVAYRDRFTSRRFSPEPRREIRSTPESRGFRTRDIERRLESPQREERRREGIRTPQELQRKEPPPPSALERRREGPGDRGDRVREAPRVPREERMRETPGLPREERREGRPPVVRESPFSGVGSGGFERRSSERGSSSREGGGAVRRGGGDGPRPGGGGQMRQQPAPSPRGGGGDRGSGGGSRGGKR